MNNKILNIQERFEKAKQYQHRQLEERLQLLDERRQIWENLYQYCVDQIETMLQHPELSKVELDASYADLQFHFRLINKRTIPEILEIVRSIDIYRAEPEETTEFWGKKFVFQPDQDLLIATCGGNYDSVSSVAFWLHLTFRLGENADCELVLLKEEEIIEKRRKEIYSLECRNGEAW